MNRSTLLGLATLLLPLSGAAQLHIGFETNDSYTGLGVYDSWDDSPFRTGALQGNVKVITNELTQEDEILGIAPNATEKMLAVQCSRFGSNRFGARIDLATPFELNTTVKYVHVFINKPTEGRVMLIGLGKRTERADQSAETEQFCVLSTSKVTPGKWSDAVFAIKGAGGIEVRSLVVVPECESPHNRTEDFAAYIDEIEINSVSTPRVIYGDYPLNYEATQVSGKSGNYLNSIALNGSADGSQTIAVGSNDPQYIYRDLLGKTFTAKAGETLTPSFSFTSNWMNGYVYLDRGNDGKFTADLNEDYTIPEGSDIMTYSYVETVENTEGYKSDGTKISGNARNFINPPAFRLPSDLANGFYRMRFKVDWGNVDPAGRNTTTNSIVQNGGMIVDVRMNIHSDEISVSRVGGLNGDLLNEDGTELVTRTVPFGQPFTIAAQPASDNFELSYIRIRHGYNLTGDSLVHGTPQYVDEIIPAYLFRENKYTIPAEYMDGDVVIEPYFVDAGAAPSGDEYALNFATDLAITRDDRRLNNFTFAATQGGSSTVTLNAEGTNYVYRDMTNKQVSVVPGDAVTTTVDYTGRAMHLYLYVDLNNDGHFSTALDAAGVPQVNSELLSYTYYQGRNSLGAEISGTPGSVAVNSMPEFSIPSILPTGIYRARLKVDWNNIDPAGQWNENEGNKINDNGGYVVDFLLNVHNARHTLTLITDNGSINGAGNTALPLTLPVFQALDVVPTPIAAGYTAEKMTVRHGHNFDGPQFIHGNRQWSEYEVDAAACTLPADSIDGDVMLSVAFEQGDDAEYTLIFSDEFDEPDGSLPDAGKWGCSERHGATWNRWIVDDPRVAFLQDGQLVTRAIPNPDPTRYEGDMITGAIQTRYKFGWQYGKIEARILTNPHTGNFPAFWLMPDDQSLGWPNDGEIDIWEQIDGQNTAYHTLHTGYRTSMRAFQESCPMDRYHTYGFEWDAEKMIWYLDGKEVGRYRNGEIDDPRAWPYDKTFYIILNQSVGNGAWARPADITHTYETRFDWVRVYQKAGQNYCMGDQQFVTGISAAEAAGTLDASAGKGCIRLSAPNAAEARIYDLAGRLVFSKQLKGTETVPVQTGIYVVNGKKLLVP